MVGDNFLFDLHNMDNALTINAIAFGIKIIFWGLFERFFATIINFSTFTIHFKPMSSMIRI
jgi:hypothetical protein